MKKGIRIRKSGNRKTCLVALFLSRKKNMESTTTGFVNSRPPQVWAEYRENFEEKRSRHFGGCGCRKLGCVSCRNGVSDFAARSVPEHLSDDMNASTSSRTLPSRQLRPAKTASSQQEKGLLSNLGGVMDTPIPNMQADLEGGRRLGFGLRESTMLALDEHLAVADAEFDFRNRLFVTNHSGVGRRYKGKIVNELLGNIQLPVSLSDRAVVRGGPAVSLSELALIQKNGWESRLNDLREIFERNMFVFDLGAADNHRWHRAIFAGKDEPSMAANNFADTQGLGLYVNGMVSRALHVVRGETYYMQVRKVCKDSPLLPCDPEFDPATYCDFQVYFTEDPIGGSEESIIRGYTPDAVPPILGTSPTVLPGTLPVSSVASNVYTFTPNNCWPDICFYQCNIGGFMGGPIFVYGDASPGECY